MNSHYQTMTISTRAPRVRPLQHFRSGDDLDILGIVVWRHAIVEQMNFVRKTFAITFAQFLLTCVLTIIFSSTGPLLGRLGDSEYAWWLPLLPMALLCAILAWNLWMQFFQISNTSKVALLCGFSLLLCLIVSDIVSMLCFSNGILVILMVLFGLVGILLYTFQEHYPFRGLKPILAGCVAICATSPGLRYAFTIDALEIVGPMALAAIIYCYFVLNLYFTMGTATPNDYIYANVCFLIDIAYPVQCLHHLCELTDDVNVLPTIFYPGPD